MPTFLLSQPLLQSWAAASTSILSPTVQMRRRGVCVAKPHSLLGRGPATHGPGNFPISPPGAGTRSGTVSTSCSFPSPAQAGTRAAEAGIAR